MTSTYRDMVAVFAVLCLVSMSRSAPLACEDLVRRLDQLDPSHLEGRWALVAGGFSDPTHLEFFKRRDSSSIDFANSTANSSIFFTPSTLFDGKCYSQSHNVSLEGSSLTFDVRDQVNLTITFLHTSCPDCLVMRYDNELKQPQRLLLFSKRREVNQKGMEEYNAQVECLKMHPPAVLDPTKELCPEETAGDRATQTI